jgi:DNA-binding NarL/FixJ family response regulator
LVLNPPGSHRVDTQERPHNGCSTGTDCLQLAVSEGATGTIRRNTTPDELFRAIRIIASGKAWYEAGTATAIMRHALAGNGKAPLALSSRELEVAELISAGRSNKEISSTLEISEPTVKKHVGHILEKLGLQDRLQVGLYVARNPLVLQPLEGKRR